MSDDTENHTIALLREMRKEMKAGFDDVNTRMDGLTHILTLMAGHSHDLDDRVANLEDAANLAQDT